MTIQMFPSANKREESQPLLPHAQHHESPRRTATYTELLGLSFMAFSTVGYSCMTVLIRLAELQYQFHPASSVLLRGVLHTLASAVLAFAVFRVSPTSLTPSQRRLLLFRGMIGACGMLCLYNALNYIPAAHVISIFAFSPVITMVLSHYVLREDITALDLFSAVLGLLGVYLIAQPDSSSSSASVHLFGSFLALCGACFASTGYVCVRSMGTNVHFMLSILSLSSCCILGSSVLGQKQAFYDIVTNHSGAYIVVLASVFAFLGQSFLNKGLQMCNAGPGTIMRNLDVPLVYIMGIFVLGEKPDMTRLLGSSLVVLAALLVGMSKLLSS